MINLVNYVQLFILVVHKLVHRIANILICFTTLQIEFKVMNLKMHLP